MRRDTETWIWRRPHLIYVHMWTSPKTCTLLVLRLSRNSFPRSKRRTQYFLNDMMKIALGVMAVLTLGSARALESDGSNNSINGINGNSSSNRILRAGVFHFPPFVTVSTGTSGQLQFGGSDVALVQTIARDIGFQEASSELSDIRHGLVVRIAGSHPAGPGSIPGGGRTFLLSPRKETNTLFA